LPIQQLAAIHLGRKAMTRDGLELRGSLSAGPHAVLRGQSFASGCSLPVPPMRQLQQLVRPSKPQVALTPHR